MQEARLSHNSFQPNFVPLGRERRVFSFGNVQRWSPCFSMSVDRNSLKAELQRIDVPSQMSLRAAAGAGLQFIGPFLTNLRQRSLDSGKRVGFQSTVARNARAGRS